MYKNHGAICALAVSATALLSLLTADPAAAAHPTACGSDRGYQYGSVVNHGLVLDGKGSPKIFHNGTADNATLTLSQSSSGTVQWSVNGSITGTGGYDFAVIKASVSGTIGGSYSSSNSESQTVSATITIRPKYYGILQGGVFRRYTTGHYYFDNGNCTTTTGSQISTKLPVVADGQDSVTNSTGVVPWDQQ